MKRWSVRRHPIVGGLLGLGGGVGGGVGGWGLVFFGWGGVWLWCGVGGLGVGLGVWHPFKKTPFAAPSLCQIWGKKGRMMDKRKVSIDAEG